MEERIPYDTDDDIPWDDSLQFPEYLVDTGEEND